MRNYLKIEDLSFIMLRLQRLEMSDITGIVIGLQLFVCPLVIGFILFFAIIQSLRKRK